MPVMSLHPVKSACAALALLALAAAPPARAQEAPAQPRTLAVPAGAAWRHAGTGMVLPASAEGLARAHVRDSGDGELDVLASYANREEGIIALVYIYRTLTPNVPLWFDRAIAQVVLQQPGTAPPAISGFTRPGASAASGLRAALNDNVPGMRSTAIAIAPLGSWLVKVRLGSTRLYPAALDQRLSAFVGALSWPAETGTARPAVPVEPCATPLRLRQARIVRTETADMLLDSVIASVPTVGNERPPPVYCREPGATVERGVYRPDGASDSYLIALHDAGIALGLGDASGLSALLGNGGGSRRFSMTLLERNSSSTLPSFNRLPPPDQALAVARASRPTSTTTVGD